VGKQAANESSGEENLVSMVWQWWNPYVPSGEENLVSMVWQWWNPYVPSGEENSVKNWEFSPTRYRGNRESPYPEWIPDRPEFPRGRLVCTG
jgi:hypothetical protein